MRQLGAPGAAYTRFRMLGACRCFSTCTVEAAAEFLNAIPSTVPAGSFEDTWLPYLRTVYGHDLSLPFDLTHLNFFFHHSRRWATQHARVAWPMAPCPSDRRLNGSWTKCPEAVCAKWLATAAAPPRPTRIREEHISALLFVDRDETAGVLIGHRHARWRPVANNSLVEVMRARAGATAGIALASYESCWCARDNSTSLQYGCWFFAVRGTGIFLDVRRTLVLPHKRQGVASLEWQYEAAVGKPPPKGSTGTLRAVFDRNIAFVADHLGYDTVQIHFDELPVPVSEIVTTPRYACDVQNSGGAGVFHQQKRYRQTPCAPVPLQKMWGNSSECICDMGVGILNCGGKPP